MDFVDALKMFTNVKISPHESMAKHTGYGVGGNAKYFVEVFSFKDVRDVIEFATINSLQYKIIGNGTNVLFSDRGFNGVIISTKNLSNISQSNGLIVASCGAPLVKVFNFAREKNFCGFSELCGIPASVGGALCMNASAFGKNISDFIEYVDILKDGKLQRLSANECGFRYRGSKLLDEKRVIFSAGFRFSLNKNTDKNPDEYYFKLRKESQPQGRSLGSVFKNPQGDYAGRIIDSLGLKGYSFNKARISEKHGNFIVLDDGASAQDVFTLIKNIKAIVKEKANVILKEEIEFVGEF